ncbi:phosphoglycerate mutase [Vandammella animalimorsus]|uniref:Phosphoglycerate mutase n=1 Tax=Vandammella animalimorsus TaxID=2029117 RepID=A0A2A2T3T4_9BURK|nr:phosphoglycerate mutase [Vandammella animalimorsus]PAT31643.1 phosphoglycerate mutase [Vandammella animalimorsus]PAX16202.1 phosphoglycerate mutase [Vandammella animalimorsus]PAX18231.1 phosphoglycerate mutase [Vandammella animalimorsus]
MPAAVMPIVTHILPFAAVHGMQAFSSASGAQLQLPALQALLGQVAAPQWLELPSDSPLMPHELALLQAAWPDTAEAAAAAATAAANAPGAAQGLPALAALRALQHGLAVQPGQGWALVTPCHLQIRTDAIVLHDPAQLALSPAHNAALLAALRALWSDDAQGQAEDGLQLWPLPDGQWLAQAPWLAGLAMPSLERVIGQDVRHWLPGLGGARGPASTLQRLQTEAQMLLYTHPVNDERAAQGLAPVNALWFSGTGVVPPQASAAQPRLAHIQQYTALRDAALAGDFHAWAAQWQALDASLLQQLLATPPSAEGPAWQLLLAGERRAAWLRPQAPHWLQRLRQALGLRPRDAAMQLLQQL